MERRMNRSKELNNMTIYAGFDHADYEHVWFTTDRKEIRGFEYKASIRAPRGTYVEFIWNDEGGWFMKVPSPKEAVRKLTKEFQRQLDEDPTLEEYFVEEFPPFFSGVYVDRQDYDTPFDAAKAAIRNHFYQEPDGDSNFGIDWRKIEDFAE